MQNAHANAKMVLSVREIAFLVSAVFAYNAVRLTPVKHRGMINRFGVITSMPPGIGLKIPFIDTQENIHTGFDTDFVENAKCMSADNVLLTFRKVYADNRFSCNIANATCFNLVYIDHYISDSQVKAKSGGKFVPEMGTIFKHLPKAMSKACRKYMSYQLKKSWHLIYQDVLNELNAESPDGIEVVAIRTDQPTFANEEWRMSISGMLSSNIYTGLKWVGETKLE